VSLAALASDGSLASEAVRAAAVAAVLGLVLLAAEIWRRAANPPAEWTRKLIHSMTGLVAISFPWMFARFETLLVLAAGMIALLLVARRTGKLRSLYGVERSSLGDVYFPLAVLLLFAVGRGRPVFYAISIAALVVCDAAAAVLGREYGRHRFVVTTDQKTLEGSAAFFLSSFLVFHLPLLLATDATRWAAVLVAFQLALLVTSFEAISAGGSDNLVVPLATYYLLVKLTENTAYGIAIQLVAQLSLLLFMLLLASRTRLVTLSGAVAAHLVLYAAFSLGGPWWTVAPAIALAGFVALDRAHRDAVGRAHDPRHVTAIFYLAVVAVACLFADNSILAWSTAPGPLARDHAFFAPFVGALAAPLAVAATWTARVLPATRAWPRPARALAAGVLAWVAVAPLGILAVRGSIDAEESAVVAAIVAVALAVYALSGRLLGPPKSVRADLQVVAGAVAFACAALLPLHLALRAWGDAP
jgi:phytol kinase